MSTMLCPNCQTSMQEVSRQNVQFEVCGNCRGVWLDRSELEKLMDFMQKIDYEERHVGSQHIPAVGPKEENEYHQEHYDDPDRYRRPGSHPRKSVFERLEEIFK